jgi:methyltransferase (TIGR00027 family)
MAKQSVGNTALGAATCRLIEQSQPAETRLFNDPVVKYLVGTLIRMLMQLASMRNFTIKQTEAVMPGLYGLQICRARFIDDAVQAALSQGIEQVVILGAGLDTRPYRLASLERVKVFEVDLPSVQEDKKKKLQKHFGRLPEHVTFIPIDFDTQSLEVVLTRTAFDSSKPAVFVCEGVTQYLSVEAVRWTLAFVGESAPGSILVFTYVLKSIIERRSDVPGTDRIMDRVAKQKAPWLFGLEPSDVPSFLKLFHLDLIADIGNADYQARYLKPLGRKLVVSESERIVQATVVRPW